MAVADASGDRPPTCPPGTSARGRKRRVEWRVGIASAGRLYTAAMAPRRLVAAAVAVVAVLVAGCGGSSEPDSRPVPATTGDVADLKTVDDVRDAFAAAEGSPRLLLLLSPT